MIFGYVRVSSMEQAAEGTTSLEEQERKCQAIAQLRGADSFNFTCFKDAGVSGTLPLSHRPAGSEMLETATTGDTIVASKMDRLFRSASDALTTAEHLKARGIDLILADMSVEPVTANGAAKMFFGMLALVAEFERGRIAERMEDGRRGKRQRGGHLGGEPPYGFRKEGEGRQAKLVPDEREQEIVREVVTLSRRFAPASVVKLLATKNMLGRQDRPLGFMQIKRIVARQKEHNLASH